MNVPSAHLLFPFLLASGLQWGAGEAHKDLIRQTVAQERVGVPIAFTPDSKRLVVKEAVKVNGKWQRALALLDPTTGKELRRSTPIAHEFNRAFFSPDGKFLVLSFNSHNPFVWDVNRWQMKLPPLGLDGHLGHGSPLGLATGGRALLTLYQTKDYKRQTLVAWDLQTGTPQILGEEPWGWIEAGQGTPKKAFYPEDGGPYILLDYAVGGSLSCLYLWDQVRKKRLPQAVLQISIIGREPIIIEGLRFVLTPERKVVVLPDYRDQPMHVVQGPHGRLSLRRMDRGEIWNVKARLVNWWSYPVLSPDGRYLAAAGGFRVNAKTWKGKPLLMVWDVGRLQALLKKLGPSGHPKPTQEKEWAPFFEDPRARAAERLRMAEEFRRRGWTFSTPLDPSPWGYEAQLEVHEAMRSLVRHPREAVPWLRKQLGPPAAAHAVRQIPQWIKDLDAREFSRRDHAAEELKRVARAARPHLLRALAGNPSLEKRRRLEGILAKGPDPFFVELRMLRVIDVLRAINSAEARTFLRAIAAGGYGEDFAAPAGRALQRLAINRASDK